MPGFIIEELVDGRFTIFVPSVPTPMAGAVYILTPDRVHRLDVPFTQAITTITRWGSGCQDLVAAMKPREKGLTGSVQEHRAVERVALDGLEAGVADDAAQLFFGGAVAEVPAALTTFSSSITEPTSLPPKWRPSSSTFSPCVTQLACTFSMLSR